MSHSKAEVVNDLALETSGLALLLHHICEDGNLLETSHHIVELSFCFHGWKLSYREVYVWWTHLTITQEQYDKTISPSKS
ncbi:hypothetical protein C8J57DRAFT_1533842 [Mycena rebaudengoi]|nr:hypothetical protein C8J57DRAFT_1533842 [Mycena rebaudengoi]